MFKRLQGRKERIRYNGAIYENPFYNYQPITTVADKFREINKTSATFIPPNKRCIYCGRGYDHPEYSTCYGCGAFKK